MRRQRAERPRDVWAMDFQSAATADGPKTQVPERVRRAQHSLPRDPAGLALQAKVVVVVLEELATANKRTKWEKFLSEIRLAVTRQVLIDLIEPPTPRASRRAAFIPTSGDDENPLSVVSHPFSYPEMLRFSLRCPPFAACPASS